VTIDYQKLMQWPFKPVTRSYTRAGSAAFARGFGAGLPGALEQSDAPFLSGDAALPMNAVALADGEFWQQDPASGIDWRNIVHAEECLTMHAPLPAEGRVVVTQRVTGIFDRGPDKGAVMQQRQLLSDAGGVPLATIDVTTMLQGDGGFGGAPYAPARTELPRDRKPDATLELATPRDNDDAIFRLSKQIALAASLPAGQSMMRGLGCFGLAGRAVLHLVCGDQPARLTRLSVRYAGPMLTGETVLAELWHTGPGRAVFRIKALEREALVVNNCLVEFTA
jgi:acyl dehydratase